MNAFAANAIAIIIIIIFHFHWWLSAVLKCILQFLPEEFPFHNNFIYFIFVCSVLFWLRSSSGKPNRNGAVMMCKMAKIWIFKLVCHWLRWIWIPLSCAYGMWSLVHIFVSMDFVCVLVYQYNKINMVMVSWWNKNTKRKTRRSNMTPHCEYEMTADPVWVCVSVSQSA